MEGLEMIKTRIEKVEENISTIQEDIGTIKTDNAVMKNDMKHIIETLAKLNCPRHVEDIETLKTSVSSLRTVWATITGGTVFVSILVGLFEFIRGVSLK